MGRADLHLHTNLSDGRPSPAELAARLLESRLDVVAVTDHDTLEGALRVREALRGQGPDLVLGVEVSSRDGHVLGLYLERDIPAGLSAEATIDRIHSEGGIAVAAHPFFPRLSVGDLAGALPFDAIEVMNGTVLGGPANLRARRRWGRSGKTLVAGSDAHVLAAVGQAWTEFEGDDATSLRDALLSGRVKPCFDRRAHLAAFPAAAVQLVAGTLRELRGESPVAVGSRP